LNVFIEEQEYANVELRQIYESPSVKDKLKCFKINSDGTNDEDNNIDLIISLGGDGTLMHVSSIFQVNLLFLIK
jgi:NAD kinase